MNYTLITGASRGIGEAMAELCAEKGFNLILVARSEEKLVEIGNYLNQRFKIDVRIFTIDLINEDAVSKLFNFCKDHNLHVDKLINNAGIGLYGHFEEKTIEEQLDLIKLNQLLTVKMVYTFLPMLKENHPAYLMNVASTASFQPIPYMSVYAATQSFIHSFTLSLREELKRMQVRVSVLCPGPTATDFFERAGLQSLPVNSSDIKMSTREVAETAIEGMLENVSEIIPGTSNFLGAYMSRFLPKKWILRTVTNLFSPKPV